MSSAILSPGLALSGMPTSAHQFFASRITRTRIVSTVTCGGWAPPPTGTAATPPGAATAAASSRAQALATRLHALDDAEVALGAVAERFERLVIVGRLVRGERLVHVVELDDHHALLHADL